MEYDKENATRLFSHLRLLSPFRSPVIVHIATQYKKPQKSMMYTSIWIFKCILRAIYML